MYLTWSFWISVSRCPDGDSFHSILSSLNPSCLATYFATSTSKPLMVPSGFFNPSPGWSNLVPMTIVSPPPPPPPPPPPHAVAERGNAMASAMAAATRTLRDGMVSVPFAGRLALSVLENLAEKVFCAIGFRVSEEFSRFGGLDDRAAVHEHDSVRGTAGEAHLMSD